MSSTKRIALQRIQTLFHLAREVIREDLKLAQRYIGVAKKISMGTRLRVPQEYRRLICRYCKRFIVPGVNCRVRTQSRRKPHVVVTCFTCGNHMRIPLKGRKQRCSH